MVEREWRDNTINVRDEARKGIRKLNSELSWLEETCNALEIPNIVKKTEYDETLITSRLQELSLKFVQGAIILAEDETCTRKARNRVIEKIPPSNQGGQIKDCEIIEHCLSLAETLKASGFESKRVFVSSNTKDYCQAGNLHGMLQEQFKTVDLEFATNLRWAESIIRGQA